jgi:hypothetical protein
MTVALQHVQAASVALAALERPMLEDVVTAPRLAAISGVGERRRIYVNLTQQGMPTIRKDR